MSGYMYAQCYVQISVSISMSSSTYFHHKNFPNRSNLWQCMAHQYLELPCFAVAHRTSLSRLLAASDQPFLVPSLSTVPTLLTVRIKFESSQWLQALAEPPAHLPDLVWLYVLPEPGELCLCPWPGWLCLATLTYLFFLERPNLFLLRAVPIVNLFFYMVGSSRAFRPFLQVVHR